MEKERRRGGTRTDRQRYAVSGSSLQLRLTRQELDVFPWQPEVLPHEVEPKYGQSESPRSGGERIHKTHLSLPKKGSSFPCAFRTHIHGAPNAPRSSTFFVFASSLSFHSCCPAAARMASISVSEKSLVSRSVCRKGSGSEMFACGGSTSDA